MAGICEEEEEHGCNSGGAGNQGEEGVPPREWWGSTEEVSEEEGGIRGMEGGIGSESFGNFLFALETLARQSTVDEGLALAEAADGGGPSADSGGEEGSAAGVSNGDGEWEELWDEARQRPYFHHAPTKQVTWSPPTAWHSAMLEASAKRSAGNTANRANEEAPSQSSKPPPSNDAVETAVTTTSHNDESRNAQG